MSYHINIKLHISCKSSFNFHFNLNNSSKLYPGGGEHPVPLEALILLKMISILDNKITKFVKFIHPIKLKVSNTVLSTLMLNF